MSILDSLFTPNIEKLKEKQDIKGLINLLNHKEWSMRQNAVIALGELNNAQAVEPLAASLKDADKNVRLKAAVALQNLGDRRGIEFLSAALRNKDTRVEAVELLSGLHALEPLTVALQDKNKDVRQIAEEALKKLLSPNELNRLIDEAKIKVYITQLENDENSPIRKQAEEALKSLLPSDELNILLQNAEIKVQIARIQNEDNHDAQEDAAAVLIKLGDTKAVEPLINILNNPNLRYSREYAAKVLGELGDSRAVEPLIENLTKDDGSGWPLSTRFPAVEALRKLGDNRSALQPLIGWLKHADERVRDGAVSALRRLGDQGAIDPLIIALKDESQSVRISAASALSDLGGQKAAEALLDAALDAKKNHECICMGNALARIGVAEMESVKESLFAAKKDGVYPASSAAGSVLSAIGSSAVPFFIAKLQSQDKKSREVAAWALQYGDRKAVKPLINVLNDESANVRAAAIEALGQIAGIRVIEQLATALQDESKDVRKAAVGALGAISAPAEELLLSATKDDDASVRNSAKLNLSVISDRRNALTELVQTNFARVHSYLHDSNWMIRGQAIEQLGKLVAPETLEILGNVLKSDSNPSVRQDAVKAIGRLAIQQAIPEAEALLMIALQDGERGWVAEPAAKYLEQIGGEEAERALAVYRSKLG